MALLGALAAGIVLLGAPGCALVDLVPLPPDVVYPRIQPAEDAGELAPVEFDWPFEGSMVRMSVPLDATVYEGAKRSPKTVLAFREITEAEWVPEYYRAFIDEPRQEPLYEALLGNFRSLRSSLGLDDDRYAELIVSWVQTLEYRTAPVDLEPKFPVETVGDRDGDCDDKTLLAAALLAREGYDVAVLLFAPEQHVALGIRTNGSTYGRSGYGFVESTMPTLFGWVPDTLDGGLVLESEPVVVPIGEGARTYEAGNQTDALRASFDAALERAEELNALIITRDAELERRLRELDDLKASMDRRSANRDIPGYNALVPRYNALSAEYNQLVAERNSLVSELDGHARNTERIANGQTDRFGLAREFGIER